MAKITEYVARKDIERWIKRVCEDSESETEYFLSRLDEMEFILVNAEKYAILSRNERDCHWDDEEDDDDDDDELYYSGCDECTADGDDYYMNEDGVWVSACDTCPFNS